MLHNPAQREIAAERGGALAACFGKKGFTSPGQATEVASRMARSKHTRFTTFRCPHCGLWHVGRNLGAKLKKRRKWQRKAPAR